MHIFDRKGELIAQLQLERNKNRTVGLVPTMGALHQGHLSLVKKAVLENDVVVVSVFVNPTQFDQKEDLEKYPRNLDQDLDLLKSVGPNILVFTPNANEIYGEDVVSKSYDFDGLDQVMEGAFRTGHFDGVGTVVELFLTTVAPDRAYFGEKDFQQLQIIKKLVDTRQLPYTIVGCPIEREAHGLAMSSRNERLSQTTREEAGFIYKTLKTAKFKFGTESAKEITDWVSSQFAENSTLELEYFEIAEEDTLTPMTEKTANQKYRAFIAVYADGVRLIDNLRLN
ncbi:pantoate--beta-alanine ligase [Flagellimonas myxillae]|uniref:pantoate--beta-alanine ligase n=1 Tax=Flagellimonas myxillae TaxID=2942214 RepID=UPI00201F4310|nr:pantoate--beta-alanine ligase [Muricauda myxillae]MCL6267476.1 pantoate--beta-alanine ligase [Muricauda myxillae]